VTVPARKEAPTVKTEKDARPRPADIRLDALSPTEWRVCDRRVSESDYLSILGVIERKNEFFEATRMSAPSRRLVFASLEAARLAFASSRDGRIHSGSSVG
jgi:hypothetical protein